MISDVLWDAICDIEEYQKHGYDDMQLEIEKVKAVMLAMIDYLQIPPIDDFDAVRKAFGQTIRELDTTPFDERLKEIREVNAGLDKRHRKPHS